MVGMHPHSPKTQKSTLSRLFSGHNTIDPLKMMNVILSWAISSTIQIGLVQTWGLLASSQNDLTSGVSSTQIRPADKKSWSFEDFTQIYIGGKMRLNRGGCLSLPKLVAWMKEMHLHAQEWQKIEHRNPTPTTKKKEKKSNHPEATSSSLQIGSGRSWVYQKSTRRELSNDMWEKI